MNQEQLKELIERARAGDREAESEAVTLNKGLALWFAQQWRKHSRLGQTLTRAQTNQACFIGILKTVRGFDPARGTKFVTFARWQMRAELSAEVVAEMRWLRRTRQESAEVWDAVPLTGDGQGEHYSLSDVLPLLEPLEREIVALHYGLDGMSPLSFRHLSRVFGKPAKELGQLVRHAFARIRERLASLEPLPVAA